MSKLREAWDDLPEGPLVKWSENMEAAIDEAEAEIAQLREELRLATLSYASIDAALGQRNAMCERLTRERDEKEETRAAIWRAWREAIAQRDTERAIADTFERERDEARADEQIALGLMDAAIDDYNNALRQQPRYRLLNKLIERLVPYDDYDECTIDFLLKENERLISEREQARNKALDEAVEVVARIDGKYDARFFALKGKNKELAAAAATGACHAASEIRTGILALKTKEKTDEDSE